MTVVQDCGSAGRSRFSSYLQRCRESRRLVLVIVAIALLLDNMLLTTVGESLVFFCTLIS
jgi:DHA1 family solute carrier family 18 vesicular amine transporter 1/2